MLYSVRFISILFGQSEVKKLPLLSNQKLALVLLIALIVVSGLFSNQMINDLFGINYQINMSDHLEKIIIYIITLIVAIALIKFVKVKSEIHSKVKGSLTLAHSSLMLVVFFVILMVYGYLIA